MLMWCNDSVQIIKMCIVISINHKRLMVNLRLKYTCYINDINSMHHIKMSHGK